MGSNPAFSRGRQLVSFWFDNRLPLPKHRNEQQQICIWPELGANDKWQWGQVGWMLADHRDGLSSSSFLAWSSIAQSVCQQAFSLLKIGFERPSGFESCIQQRKTTCLLSIRKSLACSRALKWTTTNMCLARARCECQMAVGSVGLNACWS